MIGGRGGRCPLISLFLGGAIREGKRFIRLQRVSSSPLHLFFLFHPGGVGSPCQQGEQLCRWGLWFSGFLDLLTPSRSHNRRLCQRVPESSFSPSTLPAAPSCSDPTPNEQQKGYPSTLGGSDCFALCSLLSLPEREYFDRLFAKSFERILFGCDR